MRKLLAFVVLAAAALTGAAAATPIETHGPFGENPWMERRVLNIAHRGGADEAPENTLFAYHKALEAGADVLEADVYISADDEIVVLHDETVDRTTNGSGSVRDMTLTEIKELDAAHWFAPGGTTSGDGKDYLYRGIATGLKLPPKIDPDDPLDERRYSPNDFKIPTLEEFLSTFPNTLMVIELKPGIDETGIYEQKVAEILTDHERSDDVTVASFLDTHLEIFKAHAPNVDTSFPTAQAAVFWASSQDALPGSPSRHVALQVPIELEGVTVITQDFIEDAHNNELAVHAWTINARFEMEQLIDWNIDGIMTDAPSLLEEEIQERGFAYEGN